MVLTTGGGTRSRHIYTIGLEMGMPTGVIAKFGSMISDQNALMVATCALPWGGIKMSHSGHRQAAHLFCRRHHSGDARHAALRLFCHQTQNRRIPIHRTDVGLIIVADLIGSKTGSSSSRTKTGFTRKIPRNNPMPTFIPEIGARD
jgi:molybdenum storage protein